MMRALFFAAIAAFGLGACDNGSAGAKQALMAKCVADGTSQAVCTCVVDKFAAALPPAQLAIMAKGDAATDAEKQTLATPQAAAAAFQAFSCMAMDPSMAGKTPY